MSNEVPGQKNQRGGGGYFYPTPKAMNARCMAVVFMTWLANPVGTLLAGGKALPDRPFAQEYHQAFPVGKGAEAGEVRAVKVGADGVVWAATRGGVFYLPRGAQTWQSPASPLGSGAAFALAIHGGQVYVGAWDGLYTGGPDGLRKIPGLDFPVAVLVIATNGASGNLRAGRASAPGESQAGGAAPEVVVHALGPDGWWQLGKNLQRRPLPCNGYLRAAVPGGPGELWVATGLGLYRVSPAGVQPVIGIDSPISSSVRGVAWGAGGSLWAGGLGGVAAFQGLRLAKYLTPAEGLPHAEVQCVAAGGDSRLWVGTRLGVARYDGQTWSLRHGRRWLLNDDVRDIALDPADGGTAWIATAGGVSAIRRRSLNLAEKAGVYQAVLEARHTREPGLVEKCRLPSPGQLEGWEPEDDDNDGGYTALYLAMESFRYAATRDPAALANARRAFNALRFLQEVTGTPGFLARSVIPATWTRMHDANENVPEAEWAAQRVMDPRNKRVPVRWRKSSDGRWLWKGDTSSDEITAHLFGYFYYHRLAANEPEKARVREQVCRIVDHIVENGFVLRDQDGQPTRWGVWAPEKLSHDPNWANEAGINSVEILSYLKLAHHVSGEARYQGHYERLLREHHYQARVGKAKNLNPAARTHIDDELLAFAWPALLELETNPAWRRLYRQGFEQWHAAVAADQTPFFELLYARLTGRTGPVPAVIEALRDQPLDLVRWTVDNAAREDLRLVRRPELEYIQTHRLPPPSERGVPRTDENPWRATQGDGGLTESDGVFWLMPYWMARFHGYLAAP